MSKQQFFCGYLALLITTFFYPGTALSHNDVSEQINTSIKRIDKAAVIVTDAYARETIPGTNLSSMYMKLKNNGSEELSLVNVTSDISPRIEIHEHTMTNGLMKMGKVENLKIKSGEEITLAPYGFHIMVFNLKAPLEAKHSAIITLYFDNETNIQVDVPIKSMK